MTFENTNWITWNSSHFTIYFVNLTSTLWCILITSIPVCYFVWIFHIFIPITKILWYLGQHFQLLLLWFIEKLLAKDNPSKYKNHGIFIKYVTPKYTIFPSSKHFKNLIRCRVHVWNEIIYNASVCSILTLIQPGSPACEPWR